MAGLVWILAIFSWVRVRPSRPRRRRGVVQDKQLLAEGDRLGVMGLGSLAWGGKGHCSRQGGSRERTGLGDEGIPVGN